MRGRAAGGDGGRVAVRESDARAERAAAVRGGVAGGEICVLRGAEGRVHVPSCAAAEGRRGDAVCEDGGRA